MLYLHFRTKRKQKDGEEYVSQYDHLRGPSLKRMERTDAQTEQAQEPTEEDIFDRAPTKEE